jgi:hypothetical protein
MYNIIAFSFCKLIIFFFVDMWIKYAWLEHCMNKKCSIHDHGALIFFCKLNFSFSGTCESNTHNMSTAWTRNVQCIISLQRCTRVHQHVAKKRVSESNRGQIAKGVVQHVSREKNTGGAAHATYDGFLYVQSMSQIRHRIRPNTTLPGTLAHGCTDSK